MSGFSGVLQLTDLDDFITPSQECIMPTEIKVTHKGTGAKITIGNEGDYMQSYQDGSMQKLQKVEITLSDCLACSGCITSAETVLVTEQSQEELIKVFHENQLLRKNGQLDESKIIIVSLAIQPILSLAIRYNLTPNQCAAKLSTYFKQLGADMVVDMSIAVDLALLESQREFIRRWRATQSDSVKNVLPMLASSCPGWVCYAEKTHGSYILPYIATTKSPQQIMGSLVKNFVGGMRNSRRIYHVTLMSCYDKKLEAARSDFADKSTLERDVDCVITAIELEQMLTKDNISLDSLKNSTLSEPWHADIIEVEPNLCAHIGSGSDGFAHHVLRYAAKEIFGKQCDNLHFKQLRNPDFTEAIIEHEGTILRFAIANGFRNIQNLVQKLKRGRSQYHFVEVMACPSGCLNGGAQVRPGDGKMGKELTKELEMLYASLPVKSPEENSFVTQLYDTWLGGMDSDKSTSVLHTEYHEIVKANTALNIKW